MSNEYRRSIPASFPTLMRRRGYTKFFAAPLAVLIFSLLEFPTTAQTVILTDSNGTAIPVQVTPSPPVEATPSTPEGAPPTEGEDSKAKPPGEGEEKPKEGDKKEDEKDKAIKRTKEPPEPPDKREFDVKPDENGMIQFSFRNQSWPDLLQWLARVSQRTLDWQELPGDYLNISTQRPYRLEEARDLFNRQLLARGYTMIETEGMIQVVKTEGINVAMVPRVDPKQLDSQPDHRFVRVVFPLESLVAEEIVEELKPLISGNGKLFALRRTNRLEAMDAVANLREVARILDDEQSAESVAKLAKEFVLEHVRASEVIRDLERFLGIEKKERATSTNPEYAMAMQQQQMAMEMAEMQMQQQMQQQMGGAAGPKPTSRKRKDEVFLVANSRRNSIIVHAPDDRMAEIESFLKSVDVPTDSANSMSPDLNMQVYQLQSLDPERLVSMLIKTDALGPLTKVEIDKDNRSIIAVGPIYDHLQIMKVIEKLDGDGRQLYVIPLRRRPADQVAGSIKLLLVRKEPEESSSGSRYRFYDPWGFSSNQDKSKKTEQLKVAADLEENQLLVWANEREKEEIDRFLKRLGEVPDQEQRLPWRRIEASNSEETLRYLKELERSWKELSPNPLILPNESQFRKSTPPKPNEQPNDEGAASPSKDAAKPEETSVGEPITANDPAVGNRVANEPVTRSMPRLARAAFVTSARPAKAEPPASTGIPSAPSTDAASISPGTPPPVEIRLAPDGSLILQSDDQQAVDMLERYMQQNKPPVPPFQIFYLKHNSASWVVMKLQDYFKEEEKRSGRDDYLSWLFFDEAPKKKEPETPDLGKKRKLRFTAENDSNTVTVQGADEATLRVVEKLIETWDVPVPPRAKTARYIQLVKVRYSKADSIVEAVKDAYRDSLSEKDRTFQNPGKPGEQSGAERRSLFSSEADLFLGVDKVTNTIIVNAKDEGLSKVIIELIGRLDESAKPSGALEVRSLSTGSGSKQLEKALRAILQAPRPAGPQQPQQPGQQTGQGVPNVQRDGQQDVTSGPTGGTIIIQGDGE
ncbi:MAG: secretin N-terminal domain-containing protein [Pirellulaceae bacterium]